MLRLDAVYASRSAAAPDGFEERIGQLLAPRVRLADRATEPAALAAHLGERGKAPRRGELEEGCGWAAERGGGVAARGRGDGGDRGDRGVDANANVCV